MDNVGGHQYLGGTIQDYDEYLHQLFLVVMVGTKGQQTKDDRQCQGYGISFPKMFTGQRKVQICVSLVHE